VSGDAYSSTCALKLVNTHASAHTHTHTLTHTRTHTHTHTNTHIHIHTVLILTQSLTHIHADTHAHTHINTFTHTSLSRLNSPYSCCITYHVRRCLTTCKAVAPPVSLLQKLFPKINGQSINRGSGPSFTKKVMEEESQFILQVWCVCMCVYVFAHLRVCACMCLRMYVSVFVCVCVCACVCVCVCVCGLMTVYACPLYTSF